jgi:hypothetical protein
VKDERTPSERLGLYAFLLGACGKPEDAVLLGSLAENTSERTLAALDGILGGYVQLQPKAGWELLYKMVRDPDLPFTGRYALVRTLRFFHGWKPKENRDQVLRGLALIVPQADMADLGVEDLRRWQIWDLTELVLAQDAKPSHDIPIVKRTLLRYALCCPKPEAARFVEAKRKTEPELVKEVEESLMFEKMK